MTIIPDELFTYVSTLVPERELKTIPVDAEGLYDDAVSYIAEMRARGENVGTVSEDIRGRLNDFYEAADVAFVKRETDNASFYLPPAHSAPFLEALIAKYLQENFNIDFPEGYIPGKLVQGFTLYHFYYLDKNNNPLDLDDDPSECLGNFDFIFRVNDELG